MRRQPPLVRLADLVAAKLATGDAYAGRLAPGRRPVVSFQLDYAEETALYLGLDRRDLQHYAEALRRCLALLDPRPGDALAFFDFGTSPVVYLASREFTPYLRQGAADAFGCTAICNDGVTHMSGRAADILRYVRPRFFFLRQECVPPFAAACDAAGLEPARCLEAVVVTHNEGLLDAAQRSRWQERLRVPVYELARADAALFMAMECPACRLLHTWEDLYRVEVVDAGSGEPVRGTGALAITSRFARTCPAVRLLTRLDGRPMGSGCARGPQDLRLGR